MIRWKAPGPYEVVFSTRQGGVSEGPYASLNLALRGGDEPDAVQENRRRLCDEVGGDPRRLSGAGDDHDLGRSRVEADRAAARDQRLGGRDVAVAARALVGRELDDGAGGLRRDLHGEVMARPLVVAEEDVCPLDDGWREGPVADRRRVGGKPPCERLARLGYAHRCPSLALTYLPLASWPSRIKPRAPPRRGAARRRSAPRVRPGTWSARRGGRDATPGAARRPSARLPSRGPPGIRRRAPRPR